MHNPSLVVMAAGMGSRYGGLKQIDPVGPGGEILLDYSIYDAVKAGFGKVVFVIRREIEEAFRDRIGRKTEGVADVAYVYQDLTNLPKGFALPEHRTKPWGTGHAVLCCMGVVEDPFAVITADDYYGQHAFEILGGYLRSASDRDGVADFCMLGYALANTLSEHGAVARGVCDVTADGYVTRVVERTKIARRPDGIAYTEDGENWIGLAPDTVVSLTAWGFTPCILNELEARFAAFLQANSAHIEKAEYFLPSVVDSLINEGGATLRVLPTMDNWYGVTYKEDRSSVQTALRQLIDQGMYPERLWD